MTPIDSEPSPQLKVGFFKIVLKHEAKTVELVESTTDMYRFKGKNDLILLKYYIAL